MRKLDSRRGAADSVTLILMVVSFLAMVGLMYWLSQNAEPTQVEIIDDEPESRTPVVSASEFGIDPMAHTVSDIRIPNLEVASRLGDMAFWVQIPVEAPDGSILNQPYLVKMDSTVSATVEVRLRPGDRVTLEGVVFEMTDSILSDWEAAGAINQGNRIEAEFATDFLEAHVVEVSGQAGGAAPGAAAN